MDDIMFEIMMEAEENRTSIFFETLEGVFELLGSDRERWHVVRSVLKFINKKDPGVNTMTRKEKIVYDFIIKEIKAHE